MKRTSGITLIEMIIVLAILGILFAIGAGALPRDKFAVSQAAEGLARDYQLIRLEAIRRNEFVGLRVDPTTSRYWIFVDLNRNGSYDTGEEITKTVNVGSENVKITNTSASTLTYDTRGISPALGTAGIQFNNKANTYPKRVCVSSQGRARIVAGTICT